KRGDKKMPQSASKPAGAGASRRSSSGPDDTASSSSTSAASGGSFLTKYFMILLFGFACLSLALNSRFTQVVVEDVSIIESVLQDSVQQLSFGSSNRNHPVVDDDHTRTVDEQEGLGKSHHKALEEHHAQHEQVEAQTNEELIHHQIANLNCDKYGGPSQEKAQEMVYWEDIPQDAQYMSPFHRKKRQGGKMSLTQFLTFEPDHVSLFVRWEMPQSEMNDMYSHGFLSYVVTGRME
ncbi:MAG: hypothetical protein SGILL_006408, partial [Bacillariaceae sp.]